MNIATGQRGKRHHHTTLLGSIGILLMSSKALFVCILRGKRLTKEAKRSVLGAMPWSLIMELKWCHPSSTSHHTCPQADNILRKVIPFGLVPLLCIMLWISKASLPKPCWACPTSMVFQETFFFGR